MVISDRIFFGYRKLGSSCFPHEIMSLENRSSALFKRAEQLKRWAESDTNRESIVPKRKHNRIQFSAGCIFLAACAAGDKEEVLRLIQKGADIDTSNIDGLTALHQACIDDNMDMVEFLVEHGADVNRGDNEGWTPLHATASCGFVSIARYLIENGANVAAVNNDGELPVDIAESDEMEEMLQQELNVKGIDCEEARTEEERIMLEHAKEWLNSGVYGDLPHSKTGATSLHVAAAKGYIKVMSVLIQGGADVNAQDFDGWTPLHAAAHWGQKEACELLVDSFCDMEMKNCVGQTAFDVAEPEVVKMLEELQKKQASFRRDNSDVNAILQKKGNGNQKRRSSVTRMSVADKSNMVNKDTSSERHVFDRTISEGSMSPNNVNKVKVEIGENPNDLSETVDVELRNRANRNDRPRKSPSLDSDIGSPIGNTSAHITEDHSVKEHKPLDTPKTESQEPEHVPNRPSSLRIVDPDTAPQNQHMMNHVSDVTETVMLRRFDPDAKKSPKEDSMTTPTDTPSTPVTHSQPSKGVISPVPTTQVRRSFVPPVRDEESETQRKAHAKRVRETRRSTQGVTLEEIKSAEQLVKKKNQQLQQASQQSPNEQFSLEDARSRNSSGDTVVYARQPSGLPNRPTSAPVDSHIDTTVTIPLRRYPKPLEDKDQDKENDIRNAHATQGILQRRKKPARRRPTGVVVNYDVEDADSEKLESGDPNEMRRLNDSESGSEWSIASAADSPTKSPGRTPKDESTERDYKKLYEASVVENERLKDKLKKTEEELGETRRQLEKCSSMKIPSHDTEKRERRALERKLSEMEEELKQLQKLKAENERLKAENRALTRVMSKLTNSSHAAK